jgi:hypothetical protein
MNLIDLRTGYIASAFPDFDSALAATEVYCGRGFKVAYLNEVTHMQDPEVENYVLKYEEQEKRYYHNYMAAASAAKPPKATESLKTALQLLEQKNKQKAKFIMVVMPNSIKVRKHQ